MDEALTFAFVHSNYEKTILVDGKIYTDGESYYSWLSEDDFLDINVSQIYKNTYYDPHPPLYYYLFAIIYSLTPGSVSSMPGIILNTIFAAFTTILLFLLARRLSLDRIEAAAVCALWAWSAGMVSEVLFLRMYSLQTFACALTSYVVIRFFIQSNTPAHINSVGGFGKLLPDKGSRFMLLTIFIATVFGFFTQYYFIIFAGALYLVVGITMLFKQRVKQALWFALSVLVGFVAAIALYPRSIADLFSGERGAQALSTINAITLDTIAERLTGYLGVFSRDFFAGNLKLTVIIILVSVAWTVILIKRRQILINSQISLKPLFFIAVSSTLYFLIVSNIAPYNGNDRYLFAIYLFIGLLIFMPVLLLHTAIQKPSIKYASLGLTFVGIILVFSLLTPNNPYLHRGAGPVLDSAQKNMTAIIVWNQSWKISLLHRG
jgi:hypothetical protein